MQGVLADCRHAWRLYRRTPAASLIAVVVLAVGMAFVSAFVSLYVDLVLKPHPGFESSSRLVTLGQNDGTNLGGLPVGLAKRMHEEANALEAVASVMYTSLLADDGEQYIQVGLVTAGFFAGLRPVLQSGRGFELEEHDRNAAAVAVISHRYWQNQLGGAESVLGTTLALELRTMISVGSADADAATDDDERPPEFRIVGILAPELRGISGDSTDIWLPLERALPLATEGPEASVLNLLDRLGAAAYGRLADGASLGAAVNEMRSRFADSGGEFNLQAGQELDAVAGLVGNLNVMRESKRQLELFLAASVLLALVAAANVSLFLLARAPGRRRELGIRMSVGAPLKRLGRQLASEAGLLVLIAALLGIMVSVWLSGFLRGLAFLRQAQWGEVALLDWRVLALLGAFMLLLTLSVSLAPILGLKRLGIAASSRLVSARATVSQRLAGTLQIAIAGTLGGAAVAFAWYLGTLMLGYPGYRLENRYTAQHTVDFESISSSADFRRVLELVSVELVRRREAIEAIPGVTAVAFGQPVPGMGRTGYTEVADPLDPTRRIRLNVGSIDSQFVAVLGLRLLYGRAPLATDSNVVLVNQALAQRYFGRDNVVGESLRVGGFAGGASEIIGVLEDLSFGHPSAEVEPYVFVMQGRQNLSSMAVIETSMTAARLQQELERIAVGGEVDFRVLNVQPLALMRSVILAPDRARGLLTIGTATLVVLLAAFGFYGTQRYLVTAGRREYAIRASLGAGPKALGRLVFRRGLMLSLPGLVLGALLAFIVVGWLRDDFVSRDTSPGLVTLGVVAGLTGLLLVASLGPARQARRTQPAPLLRED
jgi:predicted permease